jgi:hypothetical protein
MPAPVDFKSLTDSKQQFTSITINPDTASVQSVKLFRAGVSQPLLTLDTLPISLFTVRFTRFNLEDGRYEVVNGRPEVVEYRIAGAAECWVQPQPGALSLSYHDVPPSVTASTDRSTRRRATRSSPS